MSVERGNLPISDPEGAVGARVEGADTTLHIRSIRRDEPVRGWCRRSVDRTLGSRVVLRIWRATNQRHLAVLAYHKVTDASGFSQQLRYLKRSAQPVGLDDIVGAVTGRIRPQPHAVLVTFDDGDRSVMNTAAPLLRANGIPAVAFVVAGVIDTRTPYWWEEVEALVRAGGSIDGWPAQADAFVRRLKSCPDEERLGTIEELRRRAGDPVLVVADQLTSDDLVSLERKGIEVANHTMTHPSLPRCSDEKVRREIVEAHERLAAIVGHEPRAFAYPNGDWDSRVEAVLEELGYEAAFLFDHRLVSPRSTHPLRISRIRVSSDASPARFRILVSGLHPSIHRLRGRA